MKEKIKSITLSLILFALIGCKAKQNISSTIVTIPVSHETETIAEQSDSLMYKKLNYNWISYRANADISNIDQKNLNLFVVNRKDSIIYITVSKLGLEGGRFVLTPDSVKFLNHVNSNYYVGNYSILEQLIGIKANFYTIQSLLVGKDIPENIQSLIRASYGNFTIIDSQQFFQQANFVISKEDLRLNITVKSIKLNEPGPTSIRIPEKYTPIRY